MERIREKLNLKPGKNTDQGVGSAINMESVSINISRSKLRR